MKDRSHDIKFVEITDSYEDLCKQANKVVEEAEELLDCLIGKHVSFTHGNKLSRAARMHVLEECIDVQAALFAIITKFDDNDINEMIDHVNNKNRLRGYVK